MKAKLGATIQDQIEVKKQKSELAAHISQIKETKKD